MLEFQEDRYLVLKHSDLDKCLSLRQKMQLGNICQTNFAFRDRVNLPERSFICVSSRERIYENVKHAILNEEYLVALDTHKVVTKAFSQKHEENEILRRNVAALETQVKHAGETLRETVQELREETRMKVEYHNVAKNLRYEKSRQEGLNHNKVRELKAEVLHWKANHDQMADRNAELRARPDLKVLELNKLQMANEALAQKVEAVYSAGMDGIGLVGQANYQDRCDTAEKDLNIAMYGEE